MPQKASAISQSCFQTPAWYHALTLAERIASLRAVEHNRPPVEINAKLAQQRMQRWREQLPFEKDSYFTGRLALDGVTENEFFNLLGETIEAVRERLSSPPAWLPEIEQAFARPASSYTHQLSPPEILQRQETTGFLYIVEPLISHGCDQLHERVQKLIQTQSNLPFDPNTVIEVLSANLSQQLLGMLNRTMVLELNVARLQNLLQGNTPEERFQNFLQRLRQPEVAITLLQEYPVLARQLVITLNRWASFSLEFLQHLCSDWKAICSTFTAEDNPGLLIQIDSSGDTHRGGRTVLIAKFNSGFKVVYKPRSLAVDIHFQQLLVWLNQRGNHPSFRILKILNQGTYGWVEFVAPHGCTTPEEVRRFYERQGAYLALLYGIKANDFHNENLIAAGEHPILIDLESLFVPDIDSRDIKKSNQLAINKIFGSVLRVGLLPQRIWSNAEYEGIDMSGLGGEEGQLTPNHVQYLSEIGTDKMRVERKQMNMPRSQNRPTLNGAKVNVLDYTEAITQGFVSIYQLLLQYRNELLSENSPLACFAEDEVRFLLRHTRTYSLLLNESYHPDCLRNALERDRFFDHLWGGIEHQPYLTKVIGTERDDLWQGDIPMFTTRPNSRAIWSNSNLQIADFFEEPSMTSVQSRLEQLSDADLKQQLWIIRASLTTLVMVGKEAKWSSYSLTESQISSSHDKLVSAAEAVGTRLEEIAFRGEKDASWIGLTLINEKYWTPNPLNIDLYEGLPGIVLFLAYLGTLTKKKHYTQLAKAALTTIQYHLEDNKSSITSIGGFAGWGGIIYTLTQLGVLWDEPELLTKAESVVNLLPPLISKDKQLDIISGAAGCIGSLISLYRCKPSQHTLAVAIQCGDHLITQAQKMDPGIGWVLKDMGKKPLSGFSHGSAGIAWALLELATLTSEERFQTTALAAITYERSLFCPALGNWFDIRKFSTSIVLDKEDQHTCMVAWCHGAPGIGLARLRCLPYFDDSEIRSEINTALKTTLAHGFGSNHSLCHGDLGNLELLLQASQTLDDPQWEVQVDRLGAIILESIDKHGWLCGVPLEVETPGLMTGLAGIGYELLRLAEPERVPSVLVLEPPKLKSYTHS